jgi:hypothetical protein
MEVRPVGKRTIASDNDLFELQLFADEGGTPGGEPQGGGGEPQGGGEPDDSLMSRRADGGSGEPSWVDSIPDDLRNHPSLKKFKSPGDLFKSYVNLETMVGKDKVAIPGPNATPEEINKFYEKLGRPETPDKYELKFDDIENFTPNEEFLNSFKKWAHEEGLTNAQANSLAKKYINFEQTAMKQYSETLAEELRKAQQALKNEWGREFDERVKRAEDALDATGIDGVWEWAEKTGLLNDPTFVRIMEFYGQGLAEDKRRGGGTGGVTKESAQAELDKLLADPDTKKRYLSGDKYVVKQVQALQEAIWGNEPLQDLG